MKKQTNLPILPLRKPLVPPVTHSTSQPLPGIALPPKSVLRDILESRLPPDTIRKLH